MTASADHIKALVRAHAAGDESGFYSVALQMAARRGPAWAEPVRRRPEKPHRRGTRPSASPG